jgi:hypothetical protein
LTEASRQLGVYTGRVLKGEKTRCPAGIAVGQVRVRDQSQGRKGPRLQQGLLNAADEVIE